MNIERYNYLGDTNIGFYATVTNEVAIAPPESKVDRFFDVDYVETRIAGTRLIGLFTAGNSNGILIPDNTTDHEQSKLEDAGVNYMVVESVDTALGNLVLANDNGAIISPELEEFKDEISEFLGVPVETGTIAGIGNVGVCGVANSYGVLLHRDASEEEAQHVKDVLRVENVDIGTINMGSPYVGSGMVANDEAIIFGHDTTGPEVGRIDTTLVDHEE